MGIMFWVLIIGGSLWVFYDAKRIGVKKGQLDGLLDLSPRGWFVACLLLWYVGFVLYLFKRGELKSINSSLNSNPVH